MRSPWRERNTWIATWGILGILVASTASFAGVGPASRAWILAGAIACLLLAAWHGRRDELSRPILAIAISSAAVIGWGVLQCVPLPSSVLRLVSPRLASVYASTVPEDGGASLPAFLARRAQSEGMQLRGDAPEGPPVRRGFGVGRTLSLSPEDTRQACRSWLAPALLALTAALLAADTARRSLLLWGIAMWSGVLGGCALVQRLTGINPFLRGAPPADSDPIGPFINSNHLATYTAVGALVALGLALAHIGRPGERMTRSELRLAILDTGFALPRILVTGAAALLSLAGVVVSGSRGGWIACVAGLLVLVLGVSRARWGAAILGLAIVGGLGAGLVSWASFGGQATISPSVSQTKDSSSAERLDGWARTIQIAVDHPVTGTGLGTFRWAYAFYQRRGEWSIWQQAHNDYIQVLAEGGAVGALLLLAAAVLLARRVVRPALRGGTHGPRWTTIAVVAALTALAVHAAFEFGLQMPAIAALAGVLLGVLAAAAVEAREVSA
jgi:O-antigen ligase